MRRACARIAEQEFWLVWVFGVPLVLYSNLPAWLTAAALATIPLFWLARRIGTGYWSLLTPPDVSLAVLTGLGFAGAWIAADRAAGVSTFAKFAGGIAFYYGIVNGMRNVRIARGMWVVLCLGMGMAFAGLLGVDFANKFLPEWVYQALPKLNVASLNPRGFTANIVAGLAAPLLPPALVWAVLNRGKARVLLLAGAAMLGAIVLVTQSRGAMAGLVCGLVILGLYYRPRGTAAVVAVLLLALAVADWLGGENVWEIILASDSTGSAIGRLELWERALWMMRDFPFTGIGLGMFEKTVQTFYPLFENAPGLPLPHAHNLFLQMGVEFGVGGLVAFVGLVVTVLLVGAEAMRRAKGTDYGLLAAGLLAGFVVYAVHGLTDAAGTSTKVSVVMWFMVALLMVVSRRVRTTPSGAKEWSR